MLKQLKKYLDDNKVHYKMISHPKAFTAQEIAERAHVSGKSLAKVVMVKLDGKESMVVLPADKRVDLEVLKSKSGASHVDLLHEDEFEGEFPDCELGAMPPFGNLYNMDVWVSDELEEEKDIIFNAGNHSELVELAYDDFEKLVHPKKLIMH